MTKHYIYLPGFGDHFDLFRRLVLRLKWQDQKTRVTFVPMQWANRHETYEQKYQRVETAVIDAVGDEITVVGESAGGAMAMLALSRNSEKIRGVVTICGYNHGAADVHPIHKLRHPAFPELMPVIDKIVDGFDPKTRAQITTIYSTLDSVVEPQHSIIEGAKAVVLQKPGHFSNITRALIGRYPLRD